MISFKGRVSFRQYLKGKPHPWGIKAYVLCESKSGYLQDACTYYGWETELIDRDDLAQTPRVVLTLVEQLHHKGYDLYVDHYYTSPILVAELVTVTGTLQSNRKGVPTAIKQGCKEPVGTVSAFRSKDGSRDILVLIWMDKRNIIMLSTKHEVGMVLVRTRQVQ